MEFLLCKASLLLFAILSCINGQANFGTAPSYFGQKYASIPSPRGLLLDDTGDILVLSRGTTSIVALYDTNNPDGSQNVCQVLTVNGTGLGLNHGLAYARGFLYASSRTTVYRWPYTSGQRALISDPAETVIVGIPEDGHQTRTIIFDSSARLYVSIGSKDNVDLDSERARIRRFNLSQSLPLNFTTGEIFADGLRNEVGLDFDELGILWGVENGADRLDRPDLGENIREGNPAEELNRFDGPPGTFYGYPYCFTAHTLTDYNMGTQFALPDFMDDGLHTDAWCKNISYNRPAVFPLYSHSAPLGIKFYNGEGCSSSSGAFPCQSAGDAFIASHGSGSGQGAPVKIGYGVTQLLYNRISHQPTGQMLEIIFEADKSSCTTCFRPVNAIFDKDGHLIVSTDTSGEIFRVYYNATPPVVVQACS